MSEAAPYNIITARSRLVSFKTSGQRNVAENQPAGYKTIGFMELLMNMNSLFLNACKELCFSYLIQYFTPIYIFPCVLLHDNLLTCLVTHRPWKKVFAINDVYDTQRNAHLFLTDVTLSSLGEGSCRHVHESGAQMIPL